jgi:hypothetical protein
MITATKMIRLLISAGFIAAMGFLLSHDLRALNDEAALAAVQNSRPVSPKPGYTENGALLRPEGYREWIYVGTAAVPDDLNPPKAPLHEFHPIYIHPSDFEHWKETGTFRDGTVIVAETVSVGPKKASSGNGYFMGEFVGLEVYTKDSERFKDEPGYWAYFSFGQKYPLAETAEKLPVAQCNTCHRGNAEDDFVFTQYYPVLRAAKKIVDRR